MRLARVAPRRLGAQWLRPQAHSLGNRYEKRSIPASGAATSTFYAYDGQGNIFLEYNAAQTCTVRYVRDPDGKALAMDQNGVMYWFVYNEHGDVVKAVDSSGTVVASYSYDEFGNLKSGTGTLYNPIRYSGANNAYYDSETSLFKIGARHYNADIGRWITRDDFPGEGEQPQSTHRYVFCANNPVNLIDQDGHSYAKFNGYRLRIRRKKYKTRGPYVTVRSFKACTANPWERGWMKYMGPIPPGNYKLKLGNYLRTSGNFGPYSFKLVPVSSRQVTFYWSCHAPIRRGGFYLHSGPWRYTHGCVRVSRRAIQQVRRELRSHDPNHRMPLRVRYGSAAFRPLR